MARISRAEQRQYATRKAVFAGMTRVDMFLIKGPNPGGQLKFCQSLKHERFLCGANSSGKTYLGLMEDAFSTLPEKDKYGKPTGYAIHPYKRLRLPSAGILGWISSYSQDVQKDTIQPQFDEILGSYGKVYAEAGVYHWFECETGVVNFKWQRQTKKGYEGAKVNWIHCDEPHEESIYNECLARIGKSGGYIWSTLTPVIDAKTELRVRDIIWFKRDVIDPWLRNPAKFPQRDVIFIPLEENAEYIDPQFFRDLFAGMSDDEFRTRTTGMPMEVLGDCAFSKQMLDVLDTYQRDNPDDCQPEMGYLERDDTETSEDWRVKFEPADVDFPISPEAGWITKIWEHPVAEQLGVRPQYVIGVDISEGVSGGDYTSAYVKRTDENRIVAGLHGYITQIELGRQLWLLGWYYYNWQLTQREPEPALIVPEVNSFGAATMMLLLHGNKELGIEKYDRGCIYRRPTAADFRAGLHIPGPDYGWYTTSLHRPHLITAMQMSLGGAVDAISQGKRCPIPDAGWTSEALTFIRDQKGKFNALGGLNDDRLFGESLGTMGMKQGIFTTPAYRVPARKPEDEPVVYADPNSEELQLIINTAAIKRSRDKESQELWI